MRNASGFWVVLALLFLGFWTRSDARPVQTWTPEQLDAIAQLICVGEVTKVVASNEKYEIPPLSNNPVPVRTMVATVKVLKLVDGKSDRKIEVRYPNVDFDALKAKGINGIGNGPEQIYLSVGKRYYFHLNPVAGRKWYVGALAGSFDDGFAVQELAPGEDPPAYTPPLKFQLTPQSATGVSTSANGR